MGLRECTFVLDKSYAGNPEKHPLSVVMPCLPLKTLVFLARSDKSGYSFSAMAIVPNETEDLLSFGPFQLRVRGRLLTKGGTAVDLGARALDLLIALVSSPNEVVGKKELMSRVWPDVIVEEGSLRGFI